MATQPEYQYKRPSDTCVFDDSQWNMLCHIIDALIPRLTAEETAELKKDYHKHVTEPSDEKHIDAFAQQGALDCKEFVEDLDSTFSQNVPPDKVAELKTVLGILNTRLGSYVFTGSTIPLYQRSRQDREKIVLGWAQSRLSAPRKLYKSIAVMSKTFYTRVSTAYHAAAGFPGYPFTKEGEKDLRITQETASAASEQYDYKFQDLDQVGVVEDGVIKISTSILVIGSGSGGGVVAANISKALPHHSLMVVEKGFWYPKNKQPLSERDGFKKLYEERGILPTSDGGMSVLAGMGFGGGSTINWSVTWQLPGRTRREWNQKFGLKFAETAEFQNCLDHVAVSMNCQVYKIDEHNKSNSATILGSHLRGEKCLTVPQNIKGDPAAHSRICGAFCSTSCKGAGVDAAGGGGKMGTAKNFLLSARDHGTKFVQGFEVKRLVFDKNGNVTGVEGLWRSSDEDPIGSGKKVFIGAKKVICSGGTLNTPTILMRSGLKNWFIGRNLHIHPVVVVVAKWKEETKPWEGSIISAANFEYDNLDNHGHGCVIESMLMLPGVGQTNIPWKNALDWRKQILRYKHSTAHVVICRDRDNGRIILDPKTQKGRIEYVPSDFDRKHLLESAIGTMKMLHAAGAEIIYSPVLGNPVYTRLENPEEDLKAFEAAIATIRKNGFPLIDTNFGSAHQMGTCRMGPDPRHSACSDRGKLWEKNGVYIADASLMPSSSGVNPMATTMALAEYVARCFVDDIKREEEKDTKSRL